MKKNTSFLILIVTALAITSLAFAAGPFGFSHPCFEFSLPSSFMTEDSPVIIFGPAEGDFRINVNFLVQKTDGKTLEEFTKLSQEQLKSFPESKVIKEGYETINGAKFYSVTATFKKETYVLKAKTAWAVTDGKAYVITYTATEQTFDKYLKDAETMFSTFAIKAKK